MGVAKLLNSIDEAHPDDDVNKVCACRRTFARFSQDNMEIGRLSFEKGP